MAQNLLTHAAPVDFDPFADGELSAAIVATDAQKEIWAATQLEPRASSAFNQSVTLRLRGELSCEVLERALRQLMQRHDALRAAFSSDGEHLCILSNPQLPIEWIDCSAATAGERAATLAEVARREVELPFDLRHGPLLRVVIIKEAPDVHALVLTSHHIVCDGWSMSRLLRELAPHYLAARDDVATSLPDATSFSAYAARLEALDDSANCQYWVQQYADAVPVMELPTDHQRPARRTFEASRRDHELDAELTAALRRFAREQGVSLFTVLFSSWMAYLHRLTGADDLVSGVPTAGQVAADMHDVVGHCVNLLPIRARVRADMAFSEFLHEMRERLLDAFEHQEYTFGRLLQQLSISRDPSRVPLVSVQFNLDPVPDASELGWEGIQVEFTENPRSYENFDLFLNVAEMVDGLSLHCQYNRHLFDGETIRARLAGFEALLRAVLKNAAQPIARLPTLAASEQAQLAQWNETKRAFTLDLPSVLIARQAALVPGAVAVQCGEDTVSYAQLDARANQLAHHLVEAGVSPGELVGLCVDRSVEMVVAALAIWRAGAAYVPLDPDFPRERLAYMLDDAEVNVVVTESGLSEALPETDARRIVIDREHAEIDKRSANPIERTQGSEACAYVIYTSGSTGKPKGVLVPHRAVSNFLQSMAVEPGMTSNDVLVAVTTLSFDIAVLELYLPLIVGGRVVIAPKHHTSDGEALRSLLQRSRATLLQATPATWRLLLSAGWRADAEFTMLCGGEAFPIDLARELSLMSRRVFNMYGPTETTVWSALYRVLPTDGPVPIGRAIANTTLHVLDEHMQPVPLGVPGELYIGGSGVTNGYLNRPELTRERFIQLPTGERAYRTGDLVRWRRDGVLMFERRVDTQVKVRGYRIELGEVEAALNTHPSVRESVANVCELGVGDARLVAYCVPRGEAPATASELRRHLSQLLPTYMVPQHFVSLEAIPLTPNRKADRNALPPPQVLDAAGSGDAQPRAPETELERKVAAAFCQALGVERVDVDADFFLCGGHSLLVAQMAARLSRQLDRPVLMRDVFEHPTVAALSRHLAQGTSEPAVQIPRRQSSEPAPLSVMQERLWYLERLRPGTALFHVPSAHRLSGQLDERAFEAAFNDIIARQPALRTSFDTTSLGAPIQVVAAELRVLLFPAEDLSQLEPEARERSLVRRLEQEMAKPFELETAPLFRARVFRLGPTEHVLFFMTHHMIWDGWSFDLLSEELAAHYEARREGRSASLPELPVTYGDFAEWHRGWLERQVQGKQIAYWREKLKGAPTALDLPVDKPRPAQQSGRGAALWASLAPSTVDGLRRLGNSGGSTLFMTLLTAWAVMLARLSGQSEVVVGTPVRGRSWSEVEKVMGFFVNALPLRLPIDPQSSFRKNLSLVRAEVVEAFGHEDAPFEVLVRELDIKRDESRFPVYQSFFSYQDASQRQNRWGNLERSVFPVFQPASAQDLSMWLWALEDGSVQGCINYNTDILETETIEQLERRWLRMVDAIAKDPDVPVRELWGPPEHERAQLEEWNDTRVPLTPHETIHGLLADSFERHAARNALCFGDETWTYARLSRRADAVAAALQQRGIGNGDVVALHVERSPEMLAALLGVLRVGATYLPLDPTFPTERIRFMLQDSGAGCILGDESAVELQSAEHPLLRLEELAASEARPSSVEVQGGDVAYLIYTSGSTGLPKGVRVQHRAVVNFLASMARSPGLRMEDRLLAVTTLSFDIAVLELLLPLVVGAQIVLASREQATDGYQLNELLQREKVSCMQATPATWRLLLEAGFRGGAEFKALCGGEALPAELAEALLGQVGELWNMYGPTETTVWSTCARIDYGSGGVTIGRPIANTSVYILDAERRPVPIGVVGEIYIGGGGVALGYHGRDELTQERFLPDPFSRHVEARMYRTGDLGRFRSDGQIVHLGRSDFQVKVRGHRIELEEIEVALSRVHGIAQAVVTAVSRPDGDSRLAAYCVAEPGAELDWAVIKAELRTHLPEYMVPSLLVPMDRIPTTPNGKVDRKALPEPAPVDSPARADAMVPRSEAEKLVAQVWSDLLGVSRFTLVDNFLDLGGHSLLIMRAVTRLEKLTGKRVSPRAFIFQTLEQVAHEYADAVERAPASPPVQSGEALKDQPHAPSSDAVSRRASTASRTAARLVGKLLAGIRRS